MSTTSAPGSRTTACSAPTTRTRSSQQVPVLTPRKALRSSRLKLWDPAGKQLVTFAQGRAGLRQQPQPASAQPATATR